MHDALVLQFARQNHEHNANDGEEEIEGRHPLEQRERVVHVGHVAILWSPSGSERRVCGMMRVSETRKQNMHEMQK